MNKVICIGTPRTIETGIDCTPIVKVGELYHINCDCYGDGTFYELVEHLGYAYASRCFAPCSDIDETEIDRYKQPDKNKITIIREWVSEIDTDKIIQQP